MQLVIDIQREQDLQLLLSLLERLGIAHYQSVTPKVGRQSKQSTDDVADQKKDAKPDIAEPPSHAALAPTFLPIDTIKSAYPDQWVLLANPQKEGIHLLGGQVLLYERDKREFALKAKDMIQKNTGLTHFFTGESPRHGHVGLARKVSK